MTRASTITRLERLELLTSLLKSADHGTVGEIAARLAIAPRTLWRDIRILRDQGLPIDADRGRGGGIRLHGNWGAGRLHLAYQEAVDLLVSLAIAEKMNSPIFMASLATVRRKLMASFAPSMKHQLEGLKSRILVGESASAFVLATFSVAPKAVVAELHSSFLNLQPLRMAYRGESAERSVRTIEPHYLLLNYPVWYVLAWDRLRGAVRTFRCDRIEKASRLDGAFRLRPLADMKAALDGVEVISP